MKSSSRKKILVTGANGFIGSRLLVTLAEHDVETRAVCRTPAADAPESGMEWVMADLAGKALDMEALCRDCRAVVHLAGQAHDAGAGASVCDHGNRLVTEQLARAAANAGVERFVFLSTVKVQGEGWPPESGHVCMETDAVMPGDAYARSKWAAEQAVIRLCRDSPMNYTIIRSPLVYGPGVKANFLSLLRLVQSSIPLPFARIDNRRSFIYVNNLCDVLWRVLHESAAAGQTYLVGDSTLSTPALIRALGQALGVRARLFSCPLPLLRLGARLTGQGRLLSRLTDSLAVDNSKLCRELSWSPPVDRETAMRATAEWYLACQAGTVAKDE